MGVPGAWQISGRPGLSKGECHGDSERALDEVMHSGDPRPLRPYNEHGNGQRDAAKPIGALIQYVAAPRRQTPHRNERIPTVEIKDVGATKVEVPEAAKKKLSS